MAVATSPTPITAAWRTPGRDQSCLKSVNNLRGREIKFKYVIVL